MIARQLLKHCAVCGKPFRASKQHKCCSAECKAERARRQRKAWFREHKRELNDYWRRYHAERRAARNAANLERYYRGKA